MVIMVMVGRPAVRPYQATIVPLPGRLKSPSGANPDKKEWDPALGAFAVGMCACTSLFCPKTRPVRDTTSESHGFFNSQRKEYK